jgi:hypothetical protein
VHWDLGLQGFGVLVLLAIGFGVVAQLVFWGHGWWVGLAGAAAYVVLGVFISEVWFGWATATELQPNIDGLSFDEALLGFVIAVPLLLVARYALRDRLRGPHAR